MSGLRVEVTNGWMPHDFFAAHEHQLVPRLGEAVRDGPAFADTALWGM
jgi:hypothetical protein